MSLEDQIESMPSSDAVSSESLPNTSRNLPVSPLRALCVALAYFEHEPRTEHQPWRYRADLASGTGVQVKDTDRNGFIRGQKLERHKLKVMFLQDEDVFPMCMGRNRLWMEETLYPQYGDLKSTLFKPSKSTPANVLQMKRNELIHKRGICNGPWVPGTEAWRRAVKKYEPEDELDDEPEDEPEDELDESQEEVERELEIESEETRRPLCEACVGKRRLAE